MINTSQASMILFESTHVSIFDGRATVCVVQALVGIYALSFPFFLNKAEHAMDWLVDVAVVVCAATTTITTSGGRH